MAEEKDVATQVAEIRESWNPAPVDNAIDMLVGKPTERGDVAATAHVRNPKMDHDRNPARDSVDAQRVFGDDGDDSGDKEYADMTKSELKEEIERRNASRSDDDHLSKSGNKDELIAVLEEDDEA